jgi:predicted phage tail protein
LLIKVKPHSGFKKFFTQSEYQVDITSYQDLLYYLNSMHKPFINYLRQQKLNNLEEGFVFLDKNLKSVNMDEMMLRRAREGDVIHIVPAIIGGGGKRGGLFAILAFAAFLVFLPAVAGSGIFGSAAATAAGGATTATSLGAVGSILKASPFLSNIVTNVGLALLSSIFMSNPKQESTRENNMFGSLTNSVDSGTPIPLNYGHVRVAGQLISGYINSVNHEKSKTADILGKIVDVNYTPTPKASIIASLT